MQTKRPPSRQTIWESGIRFLPAALPVGLGVLVGCLLLLAAMMLLTDAAEWMLSLMAGIILLLSGYAMGHFAGFRRRKKGLQTGLLCGISLYALLLLFGLLWQGVCGSWIRPCCLCLGSIWGSISGVNAPHRKPPK